ncbi:LysR substrate-binding domain-containing protein [Sedimentimonas flavescens]|uniref:LysR substrate-binding domain-containing protein n=1 Tax=Sedimentimonas flavescens TaxID=2851012 RepID=UPI001C4A4713|nr:LysR substrate-binding domain-containing protein [Sedimentimonas flavescens]MBW0159644.1 LysR family transcriptional regulator [Sedimentimonas flavescens]
MFGGATLNMLRSFEAAARHGSFKGAADELGLSPSAISHAVRQLEDNLGARLFDRAGRGVHPSLEGLALLQRLSVAFDEIRRGVEDVGRRGPAQLRLHVAPSFAALWLVPRLREFTLAHPQVELNLAADTQYARFANDEFDLDIVYGPIHAEGVLVIPLGQETVTPLCSPELATALRVPEDLAGFPLIQSDQKQVRWDDWLQRSGISRLIGRSLRFDRSFLALSAATNGLGVALESTRLAEADLESGRLVAPFLGKGRDIDYVGHSLILPRARPLHSPVRAFARWLLRSLNVPHKMFEE